MVGTKIVNIKDFNLGPFNSNVELVRGDKPVEYPGELYGKVAIFDNDNRYTVADNGSGGGEWVFEVKPQVLAINTKGSVDSESDVNRVVNYLSSKILRRIYSMAECFGIEDKHLPNCASICFGEDLVIRSIDGELSAAVMVGIFVVVK